MQSSSAITVSPSFTGHSSEKLADIAARVVEEFRHENGHDDDDIYDFTVDDQQVYVPAEYGDSTAELKENEDDSDEEKEFEFDVVCKQSNSSPVSADEIFWNGEIRPRYPLFDRSLLDDVSGFNIVAEKSESDSKPSPVARHPLRKLFSLDRESPSCSSSEADDFDGDSPETYCIWKPKIKSPGRCEKSNSTGNSSKRWKFLNLLRRSNSDRHFTAGKNASIIVLNPLTTTKKKADIVKKVEKTAKVAVADDYGEPPPVTDENNPANKANVNGLSRNLHPS